LTCQMPLKGTNKGGVKHQWILDDQVLAIVSLSEI
jgi:hypothetical protein